MTQLLVKIIPRTRVLEQAGMITPKFKTKGSSREWVQSSELPDSQGKKDSSPGVSHFNPAAGSTALLCSQTPS